MILYKEETAGRTISLHKMAKEGVYEFCMSSGEKIAQKVRFGLRVGLDIGDLSVFPHHNDKLELLREL